MKTRRVAGFTIIEVLFVIGTLLLVAVILPNMARTKCKTKRISCLSNQKQIGLAFRMWANDNGEKFPMDLTASKGGTRETAWQGLPLASFMIISNELNNPKPLTCQDDVQRTRVPMFAQLTPKSLSYFIGLNASETNAQSILTGDRNIIVNGQLTNGFVQITNPATVAWGSKIHKHQGNLGLADGSAHQVTDLLLQRQLQASGIATNRFAIP